MELLQGGIASFNALNSKNPYTAEGKEEIKKEAQKLNSSTIMMEYIFEFQLSITQRTHVQTATQSALKDPSRLNELLRGIDYKHIGYEGKPIDRLTKEEAEELISEDGFFGITKTSQRLADFVLQGSGGDLNLLHKGREGIVRGYEQAEKLWGGKLPEISKKTLEKALERIDEEIVKKGGNLLSEQA